MKYRENREVKSIKKRILILCEGKKTEPEYFKALRQDKRHSNQLAGLRIVIHDTKKNTAKELVAEAIQLQKDARRDNNPYDDIWVVVDRDGYTKHPQSFDRARTMGIKIAFSSPCFEFWYFLHFDYSSASVMQCDAMTRRLENHIAGYNKGENYYETLKSVTNTAIQNGERIIQHWDAIADRAIWNYNPYTDVGRLVNMLVNL